MQVKRLTLFCDATFGRGGLRAGASLCLCDSQALRSDFEDRTFFREKRLTFCEEKSRNFWSVERQKGLKGINV